MGKVGSHDIRQVLGQYLKKKSGRYRGYYVFKRIKETMDEMEIVP